MHPIQSPHSQPFQIHITPNCSASSFQHILDFAYRGTLTTQEPQTLVDVIYLSDMWAIPRLNLLAATSLADLIDKTTAPSTELVLTVMDCVELGIIVDPEVSRRVRRTMLGLAARIFQTLFAANGPEPRLPNLELSGCDWLVELLVREDLNVSVQENWWFNTKICCFLSALGSLPKSHAFALRLLVRIKY